MGGYILAWCGSRHGTVDGSCECGNEPSDTYNRGKLLPIFTIGRLSRMAQLFGVDESVSQSMG
jgi:hypothetical protein